MPEISGETLGFIEQTLDKKLEFDPKKEKIEFIPVNKETFRGLSNLASSHFGGCPYRAFSFQPTPEARTLIGLNPQTRVAIIADQSLIHSDSSYRMPQILGLVTHELVEQGLLAPDEWAKATGDSIKNTYPKLAKHMEGLISEEIVIRRLGEKTKIGGLKTALELHKLHFGQAGKNKVSGLIPERKLHAAVIRRLSKTKP